MKKEIIYIILFCSSISLSAQYLVSDEIRVANDNLLHAEKKAEEESQKKALEEIKNISKKTQMVMDSINRYMNVASNYIQSSTELYDAGKMLYSSCENYKKYSEYIKNSKYLTPEQKAKLLTDMSAKIIYINENYTKMEDISGKNSIGLSEAEKKKKEGKMRDGERKKLYQRYLSNIIMQVVDINCMMENVMRYESQITQQCIIQDYAVNAMFFNF